VTCRSDFTRNGHVSMLLSPSTAKGGVISAIVPTVSHGDDHRARPGRDRHRARTADLRGLSLSSGHGRSSTTAPTPTFLPQLQDYLQRSLSASYGRHTPHLIAEALSRHTRFLTDGTMRAG
jgi:succinyl-CoA:acetate CoA-transferase